MADVMSSGTEERQLGFYRDQFTETQRRRAEALILVGYMFPALSMGVTKIELANWVVTGKRVVQ